MHLLLTRARTLALIAASSVLALACVDQTPPPVADSTSGDTTADPTTTGMASMTSQGTMMSDSVDTTASPDSSSGMADGSFLDPDSSGVDDGPVPQPNGGSCDSDEGCESGYCYVLPMIGGICSECITDTDCKMGTCSFDPIGYAICTDGSLGVMCSTDEGCMGDLICAELIDTGGIFPANFCSECREDTPCAEPGICSPVYDLGNFAGYLGCVDPGSLPNGEGCPTDGVTGDGAVCQSGICSMASLFGIIPVGVCGDCVDDMDCMPMQTCQPASADETGLQGSMCI